MNEKSLVLRQFMDRPEAWGRTEGREVFQHLLDYVEDNAGTLVFKVSLKGVRRLDVSFASETVVELARRYRGAKGFCFVELTDKDLIENVDAAAQKKAQPMLVWYGNSSEVIGLRPSEGVRKAFRFAMDRTQCRAAEFAAHAGISIQSASMKFKQLWEQGFLLRRDGVGESGGREFVYCRIG